MNDSTCRDSSDNSPISLISNPPLVYQTNRQRRNRMASAPYWLVAALISVDLFLTMHNECTETSFRLEVGLLGIPCRVCIALMELCGPLVDTRYQGTLLSVCHVEYEGLSSFCG